MERNDESRANAFLLTYFCDLNRLLRVQTISGFIVMIIMIIIVIIIVRTFSLMFDVRMGV